MSVPGEMKELCKQVLLDYEAGCSKFASNKTNARKVGCSPSLLSPHHPPWTSLSGLSSRLSSREWLVVQVLTPLLARLMHNLHEKLPTILFSPHRIEDMAQETADRYVNGCRALASNSSNIRNVLPPLLFEIEQRFVALWTKYNEGNHR